MALERPDGNDGERHPVGQWNRNIDAHRLACRNPRKPFVTSLAGTVTASVRSRMFDPGTVDRPSGLYFGSRY